MPKNPYPYYYNESESVFIYFFLTQRRSVCFLKIICGETESIDYLYISYVFSVNFALPLIWNIKSISNLRSWSYNINMSLTDFKKRRLYRSNVSLRRLACVDPKQCVSLAQPRSKTRCPTSKLLT